MPDVAEGTTVHAERDTSVAIDPAAAGGRQQRPICHDRESNSAMSSPGVIVGGQH